ncbi:MAG: hypothetical protein Q7R47_06175 [Candidatus Diapherotrites archaeon]|nr:hypothetical protein [Candidatus Diapherotrites archaeon]
MPGRIRRWLGGLVSRKKTPAPAVPLIKKHQIGGKVDRIRESVEHGRDPTQIAQPKPKESPKGVVSLEAKRALQSQKDQQAYNASLVNGALSMASFTAACQKSKKDPPKEFAGLYAHAKRTAAWAPISRLMDEIHLQAHSEGLTDHEMARVAQLMTEERDAYYRQREATVAQQEGKMLGALFATVLNMQAMSPQARSEYIANQKSLVSARIARKINTVLTPKPSQ